MGYIMQRTILALTLAATLALSGCAATQVAISKRDLDVQTKMSATVFLDPVTAAERTIYVQLRNTSDKDAFDMEPQLVRAIGNKGYKVVTDPAQAKFLLQANVLYVGKSDPSVSDMVLRQGYGVMSGWSGAGFGAIGGIALGGDSGRAIAGAALLGGIAETIANAAVKDVYYSVVTDVQIKERVTKGSAKTVSQHDLKQGTSGATSVTYEENSEWKAYQTRVISTANKMNLEFVEAEEPLKAGLSRSLAGIF